MIHSLPVQYASRLGFKTVALSSSDSKRELATKLGAQVYIDGVSPFTILRSVFSI